MWVSHLAEFFVGGIYSFHGVYRSKILALGGIFRKSRNQSITKSFYLSIQILQYEFLGPIRLSEWGPPMEKVVYLIMSREKDRFNIIYADECEKTEKTDFFTQNEKFKCWLQHGGREDNLYLCIFPMFEAEEYDRKRVVDKIISGYKPPCNQ